MTFSHRFLWLLSAVAVAAAQAANPVDYFRVESEGRKFGFRDPSGRKFFSIGVCSAHPVGPQLSSQEAQSQWTQTVLARLKAWNFNTLGAWCAYNLLGKEMAYTINLNLSPSDWQKGDIPDYWTLDFLNHVRNVVAAEVAPRAEDPLLLGYFFCNELRWGPDWRGTNDVFAVYFALPSDAPGKIALVKWLKDRYAGDLDEFRRVWSLPVSRFEDVLSLTEIPSVSWGGRMRQDRADFSGYVARRFFKTCHDEIRAADKNHLLLGARFVSWVTPPEVVRAITGYTDVVSVNHYELQPFGTLLLSALGSFFGWLSPEDMLRRYHEETGLPVLISEFWFRADDSGLPNTWPPRWLYPVVPSQKERANQFEAYVRKAAARDYIVGYHWFAFKDRPAEGGFYGENSNIGLVDKHDVPWTELVERMRTTNGSILQARGADH